MLCTRWIGCYRRVFLWDASCWFCAFMCGVIAGFGSAADTTRSCFSSRIQHHRFPVAVLGMLGYDFRQVSQSLCAFHVMPICVFPLCSIAWQGPLHWFAMAASSCQHVLPVCVPCRCCH